MTHHTPISLFRSLASLTRCLIAVSAAFVAASLYGQAAAGMLEGRVSQNNMGGKFFFVEVVSAEPENLAPVGDEVKVMAKWARKPEGGLAPRDSDVAQIKGYAVGEVVKFAVERDNKQKDAFRLTDQANVERELKEARVQRETMFLPDAPIAVDPAKITGADLSKLSRLEAGISEQIEVSPGESVLDALRRAESVLGSGKPVKVRFAPGTYDISTRHRVLIAGGAGKEALLVIEGAGAGKTVFDFSGVTDKKAPELININNKHNFILRGISFLNHPGKPVEIGRYSPVQDNKDFLIEDCAFNKSVIGLVVFHVNGLTIRDIEANDNSRTGLFLLARNAIVEDSSFLRNAGGGPGSFRGGIALAALDTLIRRVHCDDNPGGSAGLRMDHASDNIIIEESTFNRNGKSGMIWETARGPVLIRSSEINDNKQTGVELATAYNFTFEGCEIRNNGKAQFEILCKPRPVAFIAKGKKDGAYGAADFSVPPGEHPFNKVGLMGNRFLTVKDCVIQTQNPQKAPFYGHRYGKPDIYETYFTEQFSASNNAYGSPGTSAAFDDFQGDYSKFNLIDFEAWKAWTGEEAGSRWVDTATASN